MAAIAIPGGTYSDEIHEYRNHADRWTPSVTQVIKLVGLSHYSEAIRPEVMEKAAKRGSVVHAAAWSYAKYGDVDETWLNEETTPYFEAYKKFIHESGFIPDPDFCESPMIATVHGMAFGVTPDVLGSRGKFPTVVELKTVATAQPYWAFQTAAQEMARFATNQCGRARRMAVQLLNDGRYKINVYERHQYDAHVFISALSIVHERIAAGQRLWEDM